MKLDNWCAPCFAALNCTIHHRNIMRLVFGCTNYTHTFTCRTHTNGRKNGQTDNDLQKSEAAARFIRRSTVFCHFLFGSMSAEIAAFVLRRKCATPVFLWSHGKWIYSMRCAAVQRTFESNRLLFINKLAHFAFCAKSIKTTHVRTSRTVGDRSKCINMNGKRIRVSRAWHRMADSVSECALQMFSWKCMKYRQDVSTWIQMLCQLSSGVDTAAQPLITSGKNLKYYAITAPHFHVEWHRYCFPAFRFVFGCLARQSHTHFEHLSRC